jgi:hypothetical protein
VKAQTLQRLARQVIGPWMVRRTYRHNNVDPAIQANPMADDHVIGPLAMNHLGSSLPAPAFH